MKPLLESARHYLLTMDMGKHHLHAYVMATKARDTEPVINKMIEIAGEPRVPIVLCTELSTGVDVVRAKQGRQGERVSPHRSRLSLFGFCHLEGYSRRQTTDGVALMKVGEDERDINNIEAWVEVVEALLWLVPTESRMKALLLAVANESEARKEREKNPLGIVSIAELKDLNFGHWNVAMRLKSLVIQVFVRSITNSHSAKDATALLFAHHRFGTGSGNLGDYLEMTTTRAARK